MLELGIAKKIRSKNICRFSGKGGQRSTKARLNLYSDPPPEKKVSGTHWQRKDLQALMHVFLNLHFCLACKHYTIICSNMLFGEYTCVYGSTMAA